MANSRQSVTIFSPSSKRPTKRTRSSITEHSFQGITPSPRGGSVTHVSGTNCHLCVRPLTGSSRIARYIIQRGANQNGYEQHGNARMDCMGRTKIRRTALGNGGRDLNDRVIRRRARKKSRQTKEATLRREPLQNYWPRRFYARRT